MLRRTTQLLFLLTIVSSCYGQNARKDDVAALSVTQQTSAGTVSFLQPMAGATITVCTSLGVGTPCNTPLTGLCASASDEVCNRPNPFNADINGNFGFWAPPGRYVVSITQTGALGLNRIYDLPVTSGNNSFNNPGVFTNTQMNEYLESILNSCSPATEYAAQRVGSFATDALAGCAAVPSSSAVTNAEGVAGYANNSSTTTTITGGYFQGRCIAASTHCEGVNDLAIASASATSGVGLVGHETDVATATGAGVTSAVGITAIADFLSAPTVSFAFTAQLTPLTTNQWSDDFACDDGTSSNACLLVGVSSTGNNVGSQQIQISGRDSGGTTHTATILADAAGDLIEIPASGKSVAIQGGAEVQELAAPSAASGFEVCYGDTTAHALKCSYNNGSFFPQTQTIGSGTATMTTTLIASGACGATVTVSATGAATTDAISWSFNASVGANPGVLVVQSWPTANNVNFVYCNSTAAGVTPGAATLNWRVVR